MDGNSLPPQPKASVKVFACPQCGAPVKLRVQGQSLSVVCGSCGSILDPTTEEHKILSKFKLQAHLQPLIPLGTRGKLQGETWECIGFVKRATTKDGHSYWEEYLLFNPYQGYRWLNQSEGHWIFLKMIKEKPVLSDTEASIDGKTYRRFQEGTSKVNYVLGEFYWRVKVGDEVEYRDYIAPPSILSVEGDRNERVWSQGDYVDPEEIAAAFGLQGKMPWRIGVGSCQPNPYLADYSFIIPLSIAFCIVLIFIHHFSSHPMTGNLLFGFLMIGLGLLVCTVIKNGFESKRWDETDLSGIVSKLFSGDDD